jgi:hypothetical protein
MIVMEMGIVMGIMTIVMIRTRIRAMLLVVIEGYIDMVEFSN